MHDYIALVNSKGGVEGHQDQGPRDRPRVQGAAGRRVVRAPQEGRRREHRGLRHAADLRAHRQADGRPDPRDVAGLRQRRGRRRRSAIRTSSRSPPPTGRRPPPPSTSPRSSWAAASRARRSRTSSTTTRPAGSRSRCSRTSRRRRASSSRPSRCRPPASRWAPRCSTSPSASAPTSSIAHLFGGAPSVSIKELKRIGYPLRKVVGLVWGSAEANIEGAGGFGGGRGLLRHAVRRRRHRLPGAERDPRDVQEAGQGGAEGDGVHGLLQPRRAGRRRCTSRPSATR